MKGLKEIVISLIILFTNNIYAQDGGDNLYCPYGAQYVSPGMTIAAVETACGQPISVKKSVEQVTKKVPMLQWTYRIRASQYQAGQMPIIRHSNAKFTAGGLDQPTLIVTFQNDKVVDVNVNGQSLPQSTMCDGNSVQVGDNTAAVEYACGPPFYVNKSYQNVPTDKKAKVQIWTVKVGEYQPNVTMVFKNGILTSISN